MVLRFKQDIAIIFSMRLSSATVTQRRETLPFAAGNLVFDHQDQSINLHFDHVVSCLNRNTIRHWATLKTNAVTSLI